MNRIVLLSVSVAVGSLLLSCTVDPIMIQPRLPMPIAPIFQPIRVKLGEIMTQETAKQIMYRDRQHQAYESELRSVIEQTRKK